MSNVADMSWMLDSSTFIHGLIANKIPVLLLLHSDIRFPAYVYQYELGIDAKKQTREAANALVIKGQITIERLNLDDLDRIASLSAPRKIGLGELACGVIAERLGGGMLCDDRKAIKWLNAALTQVPIYSIEHVLLEAATRGHIGEHDLVECEQILRNNKYACAMNLQVEYAQRLFATRTTLPETG